MRPHKRLRRLRNDRHEGRRRWSLLVTGTLLVALVVAGCGSSSGGSSSGGVDKGTSTVVFGVFQPFSGPDAAFGPEEAAGCLTSVAAINQAGGILNHKHVVCKNSDTRGDPADAVPAAEQMISTTSGLMGILGPSSDEASATVPLFNRAHIPMFLDSGQAIFNKSTFRYVYRITAPDDAVGYAMAVYAHSKGYNNVAGVFGADISSQGTAPTAASGTRKLGGTIVMQKIPLDQSSYRTEIDQIIAGHPQAIMTEADPQTDATYLGELKQLYHLIPIIGTNGTNEPPWFKAVGGAIGQANLAKLYAGAQPFAPTSGAAYHEYRSELAAVAHQVAQPASQWYTDSYTMAAWDSFNLMALAAEAAKNTNPTVFRPWIVRLTQPSPGAVVVHNFAQGKQALLAGKKIQYVGAVGQISFDKYQNSLGLFEIIRPDGTVVTTYTAAQILAAK